MDLLIFDLSDLLIYELIIADPGFYILKFYTSQSHILKSLHLTSSHLFTIPFRDKPAACTAFRPV